jgi:hypothetical protein
LDVTTILQNQVNYSDTGDGYSAFALVKKRHRTGSVTPHFRSIPRADLPIQSYFDHQYTLAQPNLVHSILRDWNGVVIGHTHGGDFDVPSAESEYTAMVARAADTMRSLPDAINEATLKCLLKIADAKVNVAVALAEAKKTSDHILDTAKRVSNAYRAFRRGNFRQVAAELHVSPKTVHKSWLEYKYGWMPLLMDVKGTAEFFAQHTLGGRPPRFSVYGKVDENATVRWVEDLGWYSPGSARTRNSFLSRTVKVKAEVEVINRHFNELQQVGLTNPLVYAWELIPFSFAFDWMCSVGDWLTGLTALNGVSIRRSFVSVQSVAEGSRSTELTKAVSFPHTSDPISHFFSYSGRAYTRDPHSVSMVGVYPPVQNPFDSIRRLVTGLALVRSQSRR